MSRLHGWYLHPPDEDHFERAKATLATAGTPLEARDGPHRAVVAGRSADLHANAHAIVAVVGAPRWQRSGGREERATAESIAGEFRASGSSVLAALNGHFALCIVHLETPRLTLAVDRFGSIPLYFSRSANGGLHFGTHLSGLVAAAATRPSISAQSIFDYVYFHSVPAPSSIYDGIAKLEPAAQVSVEGTRAPVSRPYWQPRFSPASARPEELAAELKTILHASVESSIDGGTYGSFLSGGLDSSTIAGLMGELSPENAGAFTMGFQQDGFDETRYAAIAARHFDLKMTSVYVEPADIVALLPDMSSGFDEPFGNSSAIPAMLCARVARDNGVDTLLAGDGGDELFAGNTRYVTQQIFEHYRSVPSSLRRVLEARGVAQRLLPRKVRRYIEQAVVPMPNRLQTYNPVEWFGSDHIFDPEFLRTVDAAAPRRRLRERYEGSDATELLDKMLYLDWKFTLADNDLVKVSRACESAGVGVVFPMVDNRLLEFSLRIPANLKIKRGRLRHFYKYALRDWLPEEIIAKEKHGFGLPFGEWLRESPELSSVTEESIRSLRARGFIRAGFLDQLVQLHRSEHAGFFGTMLWVLIALDRWMAARGVNH